VRRVSLLVSLLFLGAACGDGAARSAEDVPPDAIVVGSFDFSESVLLAEIYATALEENGFVVERDFDLGSREIVQPALEQDRIDLVPEYLGASVTFVTLGRTKATSSAEDMHAILDERLGELGIAVLDHARAQDQNGFVVSEATATQYNLIRLSDLKPFAPELDFGGPPECADRPTCLLGLEAVYDLHFREFEALDVGGPDTVAALEGAEVDVALLFTTDPIIDEKDFVLLEDDKHLQPAENVVPFLRQEVIDRHGQGIVDVLDAVTHELTTERLRNLNERVTLRGQRVETVARDFLQATGVIR
jgi:osmoprotectant transport system substrate-binding protein